MSHTVVMKNYWILPLTVTLALPVFAQGTPNPDGGAGSTAATPAAQVQPSSLLTNPDFQTATKETTWPDDWPKGAGITWESEGGKHFLRLTASEPGKMIMAYREVTIPDGVKSLQISITYRTSGVVHGEQNYMDARSIFHFLDAGHKVLPGDPKTIDMMTNAGSDWKTSTETCPVPNGATKLVVMPSLFKVAAGTLDLAEVSVTSVSP